MKKCDRGTVKKGETMMQGGSDSEELRRWDSQEVRQWDSGDVHGGTADR